MHVMANKAEIMQDIDIKDEDYPHDNDIFGKPPDNTSNNNINIPTMATMHRLKRENQNWELLQEKLAFFPKDVVMETIKRTTQLARYVQIFPMRKHIKSMFQMLRRKRINETQSTDTYFSSEKSIEGYTMAQAFYGCTSGAIHVYGMKSKGEFYQVYQEHLKEVGIPHTLRRDYSMEQGSIEKGHRLVQKLNRDLIIKDKYSEPYNHQQNPVELHGVKFLKHHGQILMDRTGAPPSTWFLAHKYICDIHNNCAKRSKNWQIPLQIQGGEIRDISHLLRFRFF